MVQHSELGCAGEGIVSMLPMSSSCFCVNPFLGLAPRLEWFVFEGFSRAHVSKLLLRSTKIFMCSIGRDDAQLLAPTDM